MKGAYAYARGRASLAFSVLGRAKLDEAWVRREQA